LKQLLAERITLILSSFPSRSFRLVGVAERLRAVASDSLELSLGEVSAAGKRKQVGGGKAVDRRCAGRGRLAAARRGVRGVQEGTGWRRQGGGSAARKWRRAGGGQARGPRRASGGGLAAARLGVGGE